MKIELTIILTTVAATAINKIGGKLISDNLPDLNYKSLIKYGKTALIHLTTAAATLMVGIWFLSRSKEEKAVIVLIVIGVLILKSINDQRKREENNTPAFSTITKQTNLLFPNS